MTGELKHERVTRMLRERIASSELPVGAKLSMRELAKEHGVSPATVCAALSELSRENLTFLDVARDGRWYVKAMPVPCAPLPSLLDVGASLVKDTDKAADRMAVSLGRGMGEEDRKALGWFLNAVSDRLRSPSFHSHLWPRL